MSDTPDRELDRRIRDLVADAVADAPEPPDGSTFAQVSARTNGRAPWGLFTAIGAAAAAAVVMVFVVIPGLGDEAIREMDPADRPTVTTEAVRDPEPTSPPVTAPAPTDPGTTTPDLTAPEDREPTSPPITDTPIVAEPICTGDLDGRDAAERFVEAVVIARETGEFVAVSDCLDEIPDVYTGEVPACWTVCEDTERVLDPDFATYGEVGDAAGNWYWFVRLPVSNTASDGTPADVIESWRLIPGDNGDPHRVENFSINQPLSQRSPSLAAITRYVDHIANEDWDAAAAMIPDGAMNLDERTDLDELGLDFTVATLDDLADALEQWCGNGCDTEPPTGDELTFTGRYGITRDDRRIEARLFEGTYSIVGLPIPLDNQETP